MKWKFEEEFRLDKPETIVETDRYFDLDNYKDWLEFQLAEARKQLSLFAVSGQSEQLVCICKNRQDQFKRGDVWMCGDCEKEIKQTNCH